MKSSYCRIPQVAVVTFGDLVVSEILSKLPILGGLLLSEAGRVCRSMGLLLSGLGRVYRSLGKLLSEICFLRGGGDGGIFVEKLCI